ncbi:MAG: ABC transporter permease [Chloroflexi bacterium]|nr:ABC transporter permease [Chloroflexota bacterium]
MPTFLSAQNILNVARSFSWIAVAAVGEGVVLLTGGIDLSVGSTMALAGVVAALLLQGGTPVAVAVFAGLAAGLLIGFVNGSLVGRMGLPPFIVTLGTMSVARGIVFGLTGGWPVRDLPWAFRVLGQGDLPFLGGRVPVPVLILAVLVLASSLLLNLTLLGRYIRLLPRAEPALHLSGVDIGGLKQFVYTFSGFMAAAGGLMMTARLGVAAPTAAVGYEIDIIAAAILGGASVAHRGWSLWGVLLGAGLLQVLRNGLVLMGVHPYWQTGVVGAMLLAAILIDYLVARGSQVGE